MALARRQFLALLASAGACAAMPGPSAWAGRVIPWRNWSGAQQCYPSARVAPADEAELSELLRVTAGPVRAVGAGHSFSALVPTHGTLISLDRMRGLVGHDAESQQATLHAGTRLGDMGEILAGVGQAMPNMPDIDQQTLAGAIATSTHGTGIGFPSLSGDVTGLRLVMASGEVRECDLTLNPDLFRAACVSLGSLGIITRVRLQNRSPFRLHERNWLQRTDELLEQIDELRDSNRHFELMPITHSDYSLAITLNETNDEPSFEGEVDDADSVELLRTVHKYFSEHPNARRRLMNGLARFIGDSEQVGESWKVFANVRDTRFNEMEYEVPAEQGPACLREVLNTIRDRNLDTWFPLEYRYVKADENWLSPFYQRDSVSISVHQYYSMDYHNAFGQLEPIFWKFGGRPHWGKLHGLTARQLSELYPRWDDFQQLRFQMDPAGKFINGHLREVLDVKCTL